jgi:hypothetical protein
MTEYRFKLLTELPPGKWAIVLFDGALIAMCPDYLPRMIQPDGSVTVLDAVGPQVITTC